MAHQNIKSHIRKKSLWMHSLWPVVKVIRPIIFLLLQVMFSPALKAQSLNDTIFYDKYWRICEKQVAAYYRTGQLQLGKQWHFVNDVKDFYTSGAREMTGHYAGGSKNGSFAFYHPNGRLKKSGSFLNDTMKGRWSYYDTSGKLYFQAACENSQAFTPLFIKNPSGDTLLKDGTGRFAFKVLDYPDVFPDAPEILVKGQCEQGKRTGEWAYDAFYNNEWRPVAKEVYEAGVFQSGQQFGAAVEEAGLQYSAFISELEIQKLAQTEAFAHDIVFGESATQSYPPQLEAFLLRGDVPVFGSGAKKFEANVQDYLLLCTAAIGYGRLGANLAWHEGDVGSAKSNQATWILGYCLQTDNREIARQSDLFPVEKLKAYNAQISFTVYEDGVTSDVSVKGNFDKDIVLHLGYYLSRLTGLAPRREAGKAIASQQNLYIFTTVNTATYRKHSYIVYRLLLSLKPQEQTIDKFNIADFAKARFEDDGH